MNRPEDFADIFDCITPYAGPVRARYNIDFLGTITDTKFRVNFPENAESAVDRKVHTRNPIIEDGETWFEAVDWFAAALEARDNYVMATLGSAYGYQCVSSYRALMHINPMPCKLVAVDPVETNLEWTKQHMLDNRINPDEHWLLNAVLGDTHEPVLFPMGSPGSGVNNCIRTNEPAFRERCAHQLIDSGDAAEALKKLLISNTTGIIENLNVDGQNWPVELKFASAVTLNDVLSPFDVVDYLDSDIQQSEIVVFPPFLDILRRKVRRIHIGTHGGDVHRALHTAFEKSGWEIVFSYEPDTTHLTTLGKFHANDGVLTVRNPDLSKRDQSPLRKLRSALGRIKRSMLGGRMSLC